MPIVLPCHASPWFGLEGEVLGLEGKVRGLECQDLGPGLVYQVLGLAGQVHHCSIPSGILFHPAVNWPQ